MICPYRLNSKALSPSSFCRPLPPQSSWLRSALAWVNEAACGHSAAAPELWRESRLSKRLDPCNLSLPWSSSQLKAPSDVVQPEGAALTLMWPYTKTPARFHMQTLCCRFKKRPLTPSSARRAVQPIAALNPYNMNWTIKARLIKADRFEFNNKQGVPSCRAKLEVVDEEVGKWGLRNVCYIR